MDDHRIRYVEHQKIRRNFKRKTKLIHVSDMLSICFMIAAVSTILTCMGVALVSEPASLYGFDPVNSSTNQ